MLLKNKKVYFEQLQKGKGNFWFCAPWSVNIQLDSCTEKEKRKIEISLFIEQSPESPSFKSKAPPLSHFGERIQSIWSYNTYINPLRFVFTGWFRWDLYKVNHTLDLIQIQGVLILFSNIVSSIISQPRETQSFSSHQPQGIQRLTIPTTQVLKSLTSTSHPLVLSQKVLCPSPPPFSLETSDCKKQTRISA